jgi:hypothetical protein
MHAVTMGRPTVSRQLAIACSFDRTAPALPLVATRATLAIIPAASAWARASRGLRGEEGTLKDFCIEKPCKNEFKISTQNGPASKSGQTLKYQKRQKASLRNFAFKMMDVKPVR